MLTRCRPATGKRITKELIAKLTARATGQRLTVHDTELKGSRDCGECY